MLLTLLEEEVEVADNCSIVTVGDEGNAGEDDGENGGAVV